MKFIPIWRVPVGYLPVLLLMVLSCGPQEKKPIPKPMKEPIFSHEGNLSILGQDSLDTLATIEIEFAISEAEQRQGLMFRRSMGKNQGMLFIFEEEELRYFWMRNTYLSLDIIYLNKDLEILTIHEQVLPLYDGQIPSFKPAQYVLEVLGGFCKDHKVKKGDRIQFKKLDTIG